MTRAEQIAKTCHTTGQLKRQAQKWCASASWNLRTKSGRFFFTDGSVIEIDKNRSVIRKEAVYAQS